MLYDTKGAFLILGCLEGGVTYVYISCWLGLEGWEKERKKVKILNRTSEKRVYLFVLFKFCGGCVWGWVRDGIMRRIYTKRWVGGWVGDGS